MLDKPALEETFVLCHFFALFATLLLEPTGRHKGNCERLYRARTKYPGTGRRSPASTRHWAEPSNFEIFRNLTLAQIIADGLLRPSGAPRRVEFSKFFDFQLFSPFSSASHLECVGGLGVAWGWWAAGKWYGQVP